MDEGMATSVAGIDKYRYEDLRKGELEDINVRKSDIMGPTSNGPSSEDDRPESGGQRPGSLGAADSLGGPDDLSPTVTQVSSSAGPWHLRVPEIYFANLWNLFQQIISTIENTDLLVS